MVRHGLTYPTYSNQSGWNALLTPRAPHTVVPARDRYRFMVIGAGYTGLAAARRLAEIHPNETIPVLEATEIGEGSSARNSGFMIHVPSPDGSVTESTIRGMHAQMELNRKGMAWLRSIIDQHHIECQWQDIGRHRGAATRQGIARIDRIIRQYEAAGVSYRVLDHTTAKLELGTDYYRHVVHAAGNVFVQPAALIRGLADNLPANAILHEHCPVTAIDGDGPYIVHARGRSMLVEHLVVANNGFMKNLGILNDRLVTIHTYAGLTSELDDETLAMHGQTAQWGLLPAHRLGTTLRKIDNRRFMVRSEYSYEKPQPQSVVDALLTDCYKRRYPHLASHRFEYVWGGVTALTRGERSCFGEVRRHLYAAAGYNGGGILKGTIYGKLLAEMASDQPSPELEAVYSQRQPGWMPPEPLRRAIILPAIRYQRIRAGRER